MALSADSWTPLRETFMRELIELVIAYLRGNLFINFVIALIAGGAACRTVAADRLSGPVIYCLIGIVGLFASQLLVFQLDLGQILEQFAVFRVIIDLIAAYLVSLFVVAVINAINPS
jgi:uncharacterized membrane protein YeaQ/YmgE (transglycosylase-associated protein family)